MSRNAIVHKRTNHSADHFLMPGAGYNGRKPSMQKTRKLKLWSRKAVEWIRKKEIYIRLRFVPHFIMPLWSWVMVAIKIGISMLVDSNLIWVYVPLAFLSCFARCLCCPHGQDIFYSFLELDEIFEDTYEKFWEVTFWREHERTRREEEYIRKYSVEEEREKMEKRPPTPQSVIEEV